MRARSHNVGSVRAAALVVAALCVFASPGCRGGAPGPTRAPPPPGDVSAKLDREVFALCSPSGPERCFDAVDDNCNGLIDEGCGLQTGLVQFVIAWDGPKADVDLAVIDPDGQLAEPGRPTPLGLVKDRDCPGAEDACHGQNVENVFLAADAELPRGSYRVVVRLEALGGEEPPVTVHLGARVGPKTYAARFDLGAVEEERSFDVDL